MLQHVLNILLAVAMTAFAVFNCARCLADGHYAVGGVFGLMALGGICFACGLREDIKKKRLEEQ